MKTLKESLLNDIETTMNRGVNDVIIDMIFDKDINKRRKGFEQLLLKVESYHPKQHKTTSKMKNSDSYFVEFTYAYPLGIQNGEATKILDYISYVQICKKSGLGSYYKTVAIYASDDDLGNKISIYDSKWDYTKANFNPKASNTKLYEVPEELNELFRQIQIKTYNYR